MTFDALRRTLEDTVAAVRAHAEDGFHLPPDEVLDPAVTPRTRAILGCSPNNPTGTTVTRKQVERLLRRADSADQPPPQRHRRPVLILQVNKRYPHRKCRDDLEQHKAPLQIVPMHFQVRVHRLEPLDEALVGSPRVRVVGRQFLEAVETIHPSLLSG